MMKDDKGNLTYTPREEMIISAAMAAENRELREEEELLVDEILRALWDYVRQDHPGPDDPRRLKAFWESVEPIRNLAVRADNWLSGVLDGRWPLRRVEHVEQFLSELTEEGALEEQRRIEADVNELEAHPPTSPYVQNLDSWRQGAKV